MKQATQTKQAIRVHCHSSLCDLLIPSVSSVPFSLFTPMSPPLCVRVCVSHSWPLRFLSVLRPSLFPLFFDLFADSCSLVPQRLSSLLLLPDSAVLTCPTMTTLPHHSPALHHQSQRSPPCLSIPLPAGQSDCLIISLKTTSFSWCLCLCLPRGPEQNIQAKRNINVLTVYTVRQHFNVCDCVSVCAGR